ncbi:unnamed protein product, partial [Brachionus calyciflorus]
LGNPKNIKFGNEYPLKDTDPTSPKILKVILKYVGSRSSCERETVKIQQLTQKATEVDIISLSSDEETINPIKNQSQNKRQRLDSDLSPIESITKAENNDQIYLEKRKVNYSEEKFEKRIKELENPEKVPILLQFSLNILKLYGSRADLCEIPIYNEDNDLTQYFLHDLHRNIKVSRLQKTALDALIKSEESNTSCFRKVVGSLIPDDEKWAIRNKEQMIRDFAKEITASYDYVKSEVERVAFPLKTAEDQVRKMSNEIRSDLKRQGYEFTENKGKNLKDNEFAYIITKRPSTTTRTMRRFSKNLSLYEKNDAEINEVKNDDANQSLDNDFVDYNENFNNDQDD